MINFSPFLKTTLSLFAVLIFVISAQAQDCPDMDIELFTQQEVDDFAINYPNCTELKRDLCIGDCDVVMEPYPVITSLAGLSQITWVKGDLDIKNLTGLQNLNGLENLTRIGKDLEIRNIADLASLEGLENLSEIGSDLELYYLPIESLAGLKNLVTVQGDLEIRQNHQLHTLEGFENLNHVSALIVSGNDTLNSIMGLHQLDSIARHAFVSSNRNLVNLQGLNGLEYVGANFGIGGNSKLVDLSGLENLKHVKSRVRIESNENLINFNGLSGLEIADFFEIYHNPSLSNVSGLTSLDSLERFTAAYNESLVDLTGFEHITYIFSLNLAENGLTSLNGLDNLITAGGISLRENENLISLSGLTNLDSLSGMGIRGNTQLPDLNGLVNIRKINNLTIESNQSLTSLQGMDIEHVENLAIEENNNLKNLQGLNGISSIRELDVYNNNALENLIGIEGVNQISEIDISKNDTLSSLTGLGAPNKVYDVLRVRGNKNLENLEGLHPDMHKIIYLDVSGNDALVDLKGLESVDSLLGFYIAGNTNLTALDGLESVKTCYHFFISYNESLNDISGIKNMDPSSVEYCEIISNPELTICNFDLICELIQNPYIYPFIHSNGPGCTSDEIVCNDLLKGKVVYDYNCNGLLDSTDIALEGVMIEKQPNDLIRFTNHLGDFGFLLDSGEVASFEFIDTTLWKIKSGPSTYDVVYEPGITDLNGFDFLLDYRDKEHSGKIDIDLPQLRCNSDVDIQLQYSLDGGLASAGEVSFTFDEGAEYVSASPTPTMIDGNVLTWSFGEILPFEKQHITITLTMPSAMSIGEELEFMADLTREESGVITLLDSKKSSDIVRCSYDPNDKQVYPNSENNYTNFEDSVLVYTIRFQNTGNAEAIEISILDTISSHLDINTFRLISTSHRDELVVSRIADDVLQFHYPNIYLPDSTSDLEGSQGYVKYAIELKEGVVPGDIVENTAYIYFDSNPPIITNTTVNEYYYDMDNDGFLSIEDCDDENNEINPAAIEIPDNEVDEDCDGVADITIGTHDLESLSITVSPNPFHDFITIQNNDLARLTIVLKNAQGQILHKTSISELSKTLDLSVLANGVYFMKVMNDKGESQVERIVKF